MKKIISRIVLFVSIILLSTSAQSHTTSTSYLNLNLNNDIISGVWKITLKDIHLVLNLDENSDSRLVWSEVISQKQRIKTELNKSIALFSNASLCKINISNLMIDRRATNVYLDIPFTTDCNSKSNFKLNYSFLFDQDAFHKTILTIKKGEKSTTNILSYSNRQFTYNELKTNSLYHFFEFVVQGIIHVLIGFDHVLFVICLLLSATIRVNRHTNKLKTLLSNTFKLITAFTIAHSITLILASTKIVAIPPSIIEPVIALSVIVLALLNLVNTKNSKHWPIVFAFGLIHGFGFAFVLEEVPIESGTLMTSLFGFNLGVEFGQLIIVSVILPILYFVYSKNYYQKFFIPALSVFIATIGFFWLVERTLS